MRSILVGLLLFAFAFGDVSHAAGGSETSSVAVQKIDIWKSEDGGILVFIQTNKSDLKPTDITSLASEVAVAEDDRTETRTMPLLSIVLPMPLAIEEGEQGVKSGFLDAMYWWQGRSKNGDYTSVQFLVENRPEIQWDYWIVENRVVVALLPDWAAEGAGAKGKE